MEEEKLRQFLVSLAQESSEPAPQGLSEKIKGQIPHRFGPHRATMDAINIVIDLRISKLAAAAAIILTVILWVYFAAGPRMPGGSLYQDSKLLAKYILGDNEALTGSAGRSKNIASYGNNAIEGDSNAVLMHWKLDDGGYVVVFGDRSSKTVSAEELIEIQTRMLQKRKNNNPESK